MKGRIVLESAVISLPRGAAMAAAASIHTWSGDLTRFSLHFWADDTSDIAAIAASDGERGVGWLNLSHVKPQVGRIAMMWATHAAARRPPWDVLFADELAALVALLDNEQHRREDRPR
jgi:hypothetical protein